MGIQAKILMLAFLYYIDAYDCDINYIDSIEKDEIHYNNHTKVLTCVNNASNSLMALSVNGLFTHLKCEHHEGELFWMSGKEKIERANIREFVLWQCENYCESTGEGHKVQKFKQDDNGKEEHIKVTCQDPEAKLYYAGAQVEENAAFCSLSDLWTSSKGRLLGFYHSDLVPESPRYNTHRKPHFECHRAPPKCAFQLLPVHENLSKDLRFGSYGPERNVLRCRKDKKGEKALVVDSHLYEGLKCDNERGWFEQSNKDKIIANPSTPLKVSCSQFCTVKGSRVTVERTYGGAKVSCDGQGVYSILTLDGEPVNDIIECSFENGWQYRNSTALKNATITKPVDLECKPPPCSLLRSEGTHLERQNNHDNTLSYMLTCDHGQNHLKGIEHNSKQYDSVMCFEGTGWVKTGTNRFQQEMIIADDSTPFNFSCFEYCASRGDRVQSRFEDKRLNMLVHIECAHKKGEHLELLHGNKHIMSNSASCMFYDGWRIDWRRNIEEKYTEQEFECRQEPLPCTFEEPPGNSSLLLQKIFDPLYEKLTLRCIDDGNSDADIEILSNRYESIECNRHEGWVADGKNIANSISRVTVNCV